MVCLVSFFLKFYQLFNCVMRFKHFILYIQVRLVLGDNNCFICSFVFALSGFDNKCFCTSQSSALALFQVKMFIHPEIILLSLLSSFSILVIPICISCA